MSLQSREFHGRISKNSVQDFTAFVDLVEAITDVVDLVLVKAFSVLNAGLLDQLNQFV